MPNEAIEAEHHRREFNNGSAVLCLDVGNAAERTTWPDPHTQYAHDAGYALHHGHELTQTQRFFLSSVFGAYEQLVRCPSSALALSKIRRAQKNTVVFDSNQRTGPENV